MTKNMPFWVTFSFKKKEKDQQPVTLEPRNKFDVLMLQLSLAFNEVEKFCLENCFHYSA